MATVHLPAVEDLRHDVGQFERACEWCLSATLDDGPCNRTGFAFLAEGIDHIGDFLFFGAVDEVGSRLTARGHSHVERTVVL